MSAGTGYAGARYARPSRWIGWEHAGWPVPWVTARTRRSSHYRRMQRHSLWDAVGHLDQGYRLPLILRYHYGLSCGEVAEALGLATGTVYVRLSEGRRRLRQVLLEREEVAPFAKGRME